MAGTDYGSYGSYGSYGTYGTTCTYGTYGTYGTTCTSGTPHRRCCTALGARCRGAGPVLGESLHASWLSTAIVALERGR